MLILPSSRTKGKIQTDQCDWGWVIETKLLQSRLEWARIKEHSHNHTVLLLLRYRTMGMSPHTEITCACGFKQTFQTAIPLHYPLRNVSEVNLSKPLLAYLIWFAEPSWLECFSPQMYAYHQFTLRNWNTYMEFTNFVNPQDKKNIIFNSFFCICGKFWDALKIHIKFVFENRNNLFPNAKQRFFKSPNKIMI